MADIWKFFRQIENPTLSVDEQSCRPDPIWNDEDLSFSEDSFIFIHIG